MKKAIVILGIILFSSLLITGCGGKKENKKSDASKENGKLATKKARDIDVAKLKEPCDYVDALLLVTEELRDLAAASLDAKSNEDIPEEDIKAIEDLGKKAAEIEEAFIENNIDPEVSKNCDGVKKMMEVQKEVDELHLQLDRREVGQN